MEKKKVLLVFGTRPEAIKMAPLYLAFAKEKNFITEVCVTAQHREMLDSVLRFFKIFPDHDFNLMKPNQSLNELFSNIMVNLDHLFSREDYGCVLVHGDTTTASAATLAAFHRKIPIVHVEAGLRTYNLNSPWPEEMNRQVTDKLSDLLFAPTESSRENLVREGVDPLKIFVTGNTVIDALFKASELLEQDEILKTDLKRKFSFLNENKKLILVTGHRRESFGKQFEDICHGIRKIAERNDVQIVYPVHLNPNVQKPVKTILQDTENVFLIEPQNYQDFLYLMQKSYLILTDSGGIQEEAPSLGKPVLVMRENTERPEAVTAGTAKLVGTSSERIFAEASKILDDVNELKRIQQIQNPYGDGRASDRIVELVKERYMQPEFELQELS